MSIKKHFITLAVICIGATLVQNAFALSTTECELLLKKILYINPSEIRHEVDIQFTKLYKNNPLFRRYLLSLDSDTTKSEKPEKIVKDYESLTNTQKEQLAQLELQEEDKPQTYDLTNFEVNNPPKITGIVSRLISLIPALTGAQEPSAGLIPAVKSYDNYQKVVLTLKAGDIVIYNGKKFRLGKFLGAGNTTHVFEIDKETGEKPDQVIRIPFLINYFFTHADTRKRDPMIYVLDYVQNSEKVDSTEINRVQIIETATEYIITTKVNGSLTGDRFLSSISFVHITAISYDTELVLAKVIANDLEEEGKNDIADKLRKLATQLKNLKHFKKEFKTLIDEARQFVWDEDKKDWYLVDFETVSN
ncbi:MAG: hypothetical protein HY072_08990 [Deltaproteobacteria bacterium]|nr:hypothetical protein [Deltaproteobacteria bacterium]